MRRKVPFRNAPNQRMPSVNDFLTLLSGQWLKAYNNNCIQPCKVIQVIELYRNIMKNKDPQSLQKILAGEPGSIFNRLAQQQADNNTLLGRIRALLASHFTQHLLAAIYRQEVLVLVADSPAWANRIRFENANIQHALISQEIFAREGDMNSELPVLRKIVVRTAASEIS